MEKDFKTLISDALEQKNINIEKLSQIVNVPERFLLAIQNLDTDKLPAATYVRGYLKKIAQVLNLNYDELWTLYEKESTHKISGALDKLPDNRFAIRSLGKKSLFFGLIALLLLIYIIINAANLLGAPPLEITNPNAPTIATSLPTIILEGKISPKDKFTVNGEEQLSDTNGNFQIPFNLQPGLNTVEFKVKRFLGKEITVIRQILHQPQEQGISN